MSEQARKLEEAAGKEDADFIQMYHAGFLTEYKELTDRIATILKPEK